MILRDIRIAADEVAENYLNFPFSWSGLHVIQIFRYFLPAKYCLHNEAVLQINCTRGESKKLVYNWPARGSKVSISVQGFDFEKYKAASFHDREVLILELIQECLLYVGNKHNADLEAINVAANLVNENEFKLILPIKKLSRNSSDKQFQLKAYKYLGIEYGESWLVEICNRDKSIEKKLWITDHPAYLNRDSHFRKTTYEDGCFYINSSIGKEIKIDLVNFIPTRVNWAKKEIDQNQSKRYSDYSIDISARISRAESQAGKAFKNKDYNRVIELLEPYENTLSGRSLNKLNIAKKEIDS